MVFSCLVCGSLDGSEHKQKPLELLESEEFKRVPRFIPRPVKGRVVSVYDSDTITVVAYMPTLYKFSVRVLGIDGPELRTKNEREKALALKGKSFTESFCLNKVVELKNHGKEKYGRVLAEVWIDGKSLGKGLIAAGLARAYDGGHKEPWFV